jgi:hypothetical protein
MELNPQVNRRGSLYKLADEDQIIGGKMESESRGRGELTKHGQQACSPEAEEAGARSRRGSSIWPASEGEGSRR